MIYKEMNMIKRSLVVLSLISLAVASAASNFRVDLYQPTVINGTTFKVGEAKLEIKDNKISVKQGKTTAEASVKVEAAKDKFLYTTVGYKEGSTHEIKDISLAGTTTHIIFE
jgi:hypothetical protein